MASNFVKRNKTSISRIKSMLETGLKANFNNSTMSINRQTSYSAVSIPSSVSGARSDFNAKVWVHLYNPKIVIDEFDSRLVFAIDLSRVEFVLDDNDLSWQMYYLLMEISDPDADDFTKEIYYDLGYTTADKVSSYDVRDRMNETTIFRNIKKYFESNIRGKLQATLGDGEYPFVKNRNILPIYTVDEDTGKGFFVSHTDRWSRPSYRRDHVDRTLIEFSKSDSNNASSTVPMGLIQVFDGKATRSVAR